ncbi:MAG TPA: transporter substrate-binding domain-containing protein, partial [Gammaproteobacteria bacterium]|nr:transporter substrate-binding domain-containing protein [Gammaproteobacteria bacterium]
MKCFIKAVRGFVILGLILAVFSSNIVQARQWSEIKKSGVIKVAVDGMTPAFNFYKDGKLSGFEVDLAQAIADRLG